MNRIPHPRRRGLSFLILTLIGAYAQGAPYTDPAQIDCPWPKSSHYLQPCRGYMETKSGADFRAGIGINLHIPDRNEELAIRLLAETGVRTARIEVGFGESRFDERGLNNDEKFRRRFALCAKYGLRPTILINAHEGVPCPLRFFSRKLRIEAPAGETTLKLDDVSDLVIGRSGVNGLTGYWAAEGLITAIDPTAKEITLSKPLPQGMPAGEIHMATLKYAPLHPVGTPEFDETATGWVAHTLRVCRLAKAAGLKDFDVEIWNELTFGTHFLNINDYYPADAPKIAATQPDFLNPGGRCWELAHRTVTAVKAEFPATRCIWGFSNTTFYHTSITKLPPGTDGQSYHPYGTGTREFNGTLPRGDQPTVEGFVPIYRTRMPEGFLSTFLQTECILRLLLPTERLTKKPQGVTRFYHYMTEHGVLPEECGITGEAAAWELKSLCATRSFCFWLNKGIDALHYYVAWDENPQSFGLLPADLARLPADAKFEDVATPPMRAIRALTEAFAGSAPLKKTDPLSVEITALDDESVVFNGDATHPPLMQRDIVAALPFQVDADTHVIALYIMTRDGTRPLTDKNYRVTINGLNPGAKNLTLSDPHTGKTYPVDFAPRDDGSVAATVPLCDHPRLLRIAR